MSPQQMPGRHSLLLLAGAGFCSALLTIGLASLPGYLNQYLLAPGLPFGLMIPLYFALYVQAGSVWRTVGFLLASIAALEASICAAFLIRIVWPGNLNNPATGPSLFAGGVVGGFIVLMAASILFGRSEDNPAVLRVFAASLAAGVLGVAGWYAGRVLGSLYPRAIPLPHVNDPFGPDRPESVSLYIVWQTGSALLIGWVVARAHAPFAADSLTSPPRRRASRTRIAFAGVFFCAVFGFLAWFMIRNVQIERNVARRDQEFKSAEAHRDQAFKEYIAETPPVSGLPPIQAVHAEEALILEDIAGFRPENPDPVRACQHQPASSGGAPEAPCIIYGVAYTLLHQPQPPSVLHPVRVFVRVTQYPNAAWARHRGRGYVSVLDKPQPVKVTSATGADLIMRNMSENGGGPYASYVWPSGSFVVRVDGNTAILKDDFLRRYLAKYPSSL